MTATGFPRPTSRNSEHHLSSRTMRIQDQPHERRTFPVVAPRLSLCMEKPLALQAVCKTIRKETSVIVPIPVVSISDCLSSEIRTIRVPQSYLHGTRRLVIDLYVASNTDLSWFVTSMPHLLEVEMHLPIDYFSRHRHYQLFCWRTCHTRHKGMRTRNRKRPRGYSGQRTRW